MRSRIRRRQKKDPAELSITAFLNLMVILIPFLLITAVFSRMTILELNIPPATDKNASMDQNQDFQLVVTLRKESILVGDTIGGPIKEFKSQNNKYPLKELSLLLQQIKLKVPKKKNANILSAPDISYDLLIQVMDTLRYARQMHEGELKRVELFPDVSFGDAPINSTIKGSGVTE